MISSTLILLILCASKEQQAFCSKDNILILFDTPDFPLRFPLVLFSTISTFTWNFSWSDIKHCSKHKLNRLRWIENNLWCKSLSRGPSKLRRVLNFIGVKKFWFKPAQDVLNIEVVLQFFTPLRHSWSCLGRTQYLIFTYLLISPSDFYRNIAGKFLDLVSTSSSYNVQFAPSLHVFSLTFAFVWDKILWEMTWLFWVLYTHSVLCLYFKWFYFWDW